MSENPASPLTLPFANVLIRIDAQLNRWNREALTKKFRAVGGDVIDQPDIAVAYVVLPDPRPGLGIPTAKEGAPTFLAYSDAIKMIVPTRELSLEFLRGGAELRQRWADVQPAHDDITRIDLKDADLSGLDLTGFVFNNCDMTGTRWQGTRLNEASFTRPTGIDFRGAASGHDLVLSWACDCRLDDLDLPRLRINQSVKNTTFRKARMNRANFSSVPCEGCDFSEADLSEALFPFARTIGFVARNARFVKAVMHKATLDQADFRGSNLSEVRLEDAKLNAACLAGCDLTGANLRCAILNDADLTGANLRGANLTEADLTGAKLDGADFTGARLRGAMVDAAARGKTIGLDEAIAAQPTIGPRLMELEAGLRGSRIVDLLFTLESPTRGLRQVKLCAIVGNGTGRLMLTDASTPVHTQPASWQGALLDLAADWPDAVPQLDSVQVRLVRKPGEPRRLLLQAVCETFRLPVPDVGGISTARKTARERRLVLRESIVAGLRQPGGVELWNARTVVERQELGKFDGADLSGANLHTILLAGLSAMKANLTEARLSEATLDRLNLRKARLDGANLRGASMKRTDCEGCQAVGVKLGDTNQVGTNWTGADLTDADFAGAKLTYVCFYGADLRGAELSRTRIQATRYNAETIFPEGYKPGEGWVFHGAGIPGGELPTHEVLDFDSFAERLKDVVRESRIKPALALLQRTRLQLFSEVEAGQISGVVRGAGSAGLHACRLTSEGHFVCGNLRLKPCSAQKGAVCKHLLALLLGLIKAERFDAGVAFQWLTMAKGRTSVPDRNSLATTFLKYRGAEAGQVDWRPTETVPEDYYSL